MPLQQPVEGSLVAKTRIPPAAVVVVGGNFFLKPRGDEFAERDELFFCQVTFDPVDLEVCPLDVVNVGVLIWKSCERVLVFYRCVDPHGKLFVGVYASPMLRVPHLFEFCPHRKRKTKRPDPVFYPVFLTESRSLE